MNLANTFTGTLSNLKDKIFKFQKEVFLEAGFFDHLKTSLEI